MRKVSGRGVRSPVPLPVDNAVARPTSRRFLPPGWALRPGLKAGTYVMSPTTTYGTGMLEARLLWAR